MTLMKSADLVLQAEKAQRLRITKSLAAFDSIHRRIAAESQAPELLLAYSPWAKALNEANIHITVRPDEIAAAVDAYNEVASLLRARLHWPDEAINILPQGSASTQTLIRPAKGGENFDIDAVCQVDISRVDAHDPIGFFQSVGDALNELEAEAKKRCWHIPFAKRPFYLEFTPSVPMHNVTNSAFDTMAPLYRGAQEYRTTALAVVDTPTKKWKTSNPEGLAKWVNDTAARPLIRQAIMEAMALNKAVADATPVPSQEVEITDTLRVAIRLFKRHRDICIQRNIIDNESKPISIIIVTLLTACYEGLANLNRTFDHPVELLAEIVALMPDLVLKSEGQYWVNNPTVEGENFAEKWNHDDGARYRAFIAWCAALSSDLKTILALSDPQEISRRVRKVFGIPAPGSDGSSQSSTGFSAPTPTPRGKGLA